MCSSHNRAHVVCHTIITLPTFTFLLSLCFAFFYTCFFLYFYYVYNIYSFRACVFIFTVELLQCFSQFVIVHTSIVRYMCCRNRKKSSKSVWGQSLHVSQSPILFNKIISKQRTIRSGFCRFLLFVRKEVFKVHIDTARTQKNNNRLTFFVVNVFYQVFHWRNLLFQTET